MVKPFLNIDIPKKKIRRIIEEEGLIKTPELKVDDFYKFVKAYEEQIYNLPAYKDFVETINGDMIVRRHFDASIGTFMHMEYNSSKNFVLFLISKLVENYQVENDTNDQLIQKMYHHLETFIYNETLPAVDIVPLDNFNSNVNTLSLAGGAVLRKIAVQEKEFFLRWAGSFMQEQQILSWKYVIEFKYETAKLRASVFQADFYSKRLC